MIFNLFILMGISWTTEVVSFILDGSFYSWFFTDCINSLMGFIIFVIFVCKARICRLLIQNCSCLKKLFSSVESLPRRRSTGRSHRRAAAVSFFQKLRNNSESSNNSHSVVLIMSSFKISRTNTKKLHQNKAAPSLSGATSSTHHHHHHVICISPDSAQSNQIIETTSI